MFGGPQGLDSLDPSVVRKKRKEVKKLILNLAGKSRAETEAADPRRRNLTVNVSERKSRNRKWNLKVNVQTRQITLALKRDSK